MVLYQRVVCRNLDVIHSEVSWVMGAQSESMSNDGIFHSKSTIWGYPILGNHHFRDIPFGEDHHLLLVTLLLFNTVANEARGAHHFWFWKKGKFHSHGGTPKWLGYGEYMVNTWLIYGEYIRWIYTVDIWLIYGEHMDNILLITVYGFF